jgi:AcrR family transcriptional regulator
MSTDGDLTFISDQPRSRDAARTRAAILSSAQLAFAAKGYSQTGVREIARAAGVDPALVRRYFSSKEGLFTAALAGILDITEILAVPRETFGAHVAAFFIEDGGVRPNPLPIMMMAMAEPAIRPIALDLLHRRVIAPLAGWIGGPDADRRAARVSMLCSGFLTYTKLLPLEMFAAEVDPATRSWFARELQAAIDG